MYFNKNKKPARPYNGGFSKTKQNIYKERSTILQPNYAI